MTADDLLTRIGQKVTPQALADLYDQLGFDEGFDEFQRRILDALRPECEAIAREMALLRVCPACGCDKAGVPVRIGLSVDPENPF